MLTLKNTPVLQLLLILSFTISLEAELQQSDRFDLTFEEAQRYCRAMGSEWRTPSIKELFELLGDTRFSQKASFWSSTTTFDGISRGNTGSEGDGGQMQGSSIGYTFYLGEGDVTLSPLHKKAGVICTDLPAKVVTGSYEHTQAGTADLDNGIVWHDLDAFDKKTKRAFASARDYCENLDMNNRSWRLPTLDELYSIVTYNRIQPSVDTSFFGVMMSRYYWTDDAFSDTEAYVVGFKLGSVATSDKTNQSYFRCVSDLEE